MSSTQPRAPKKSAWQLWQGAIVGTEGDNNADNDKLVFGYCHQLADELTYSNRASASLVVSGTWALKKLQKVAQRLAEEEAADPEHRLKVSAEAARKVIETEVLSILKSHPNVHGVPKELSEADRRAAIQLMRTLVVVYTEFLQDEMLFRNYAATQRGGTQTPAMKMRLRDGLAADAQQQQRWQFRSRMERYADMFDAAEEFIKRWQRLRALPTPDGEELKPQRAPEPRPEPRHEPRPEPRPEPRDATFVRVTQPARTGVDWYDEMDRMLSPARPGPAAEDWSLLLPQSPGGGASATTDADDASNMSLVSPPPQLPLATNTPAMPTPLPPADRLDATPLSAQRTPTPMSLWTPSETTPSTFKTTIGGGTRRRVLFSSPPPAVAPTQPGQTPSQFVSPADVFGVAPPPDQDVAHRDKRTRCPVCQSSDVKLRCGGCRQVKYCSTACAEKHWSKGGHAEMCKKE